MQKTAEAIARDHGIEETVHVGFDKDGDLNGVFTRLFRGVDAQEYEDGQVLASSYTYENLEQWRLFFDDVDDDEDSLYAAGCKVVADEEVPENTLIFIPTSDHTERKALVVEWEGHGLSVTI